MKKLSVFALAAMVLTTAMSSCFSDDDDVSGLTSDCAITAVTLGTLYRTYTTQLSDGSDTTYTITVPGSAYPMHIDQLNNEIFNTDSLPVGTWINKVVLTTLTTDGTVLLRNLNGVDSLYATTDTLDFSSPRIFTVYASDGTGSRTYTIRINVHKADPEAYTWNAAGTANEDIAALTDMKAIAVNDTLRLWGKKGGNIIMLAYPTDGSSAWTSCTTIGSDGMLPRSITHFGDTFFAIGSNGLICSADGVTWLSAGANISPANLLGTSSIGIYAATTDETYSSSDGITWLPDETDTSVTLFAMSDVMSATQPLITNSNIENVVAVGYIGNDCAVWKKEIDLTGLETNPWSYYPYTEENPKVLPYLKSPCMIRYADNLYVMGLQDNTPCVYISTDGARTWILSDTKTILPANIGTPTALAAAESDDTIFLVCAGTGQLWRGYLNRLKATSNN